MSSAVSLFLGAPLGVQSRSAGRVASSRRATTLVRPVAPVRAALATGLGRSEAFDPTESAMDAFKKTALEQFRVLSSMDDMQECEDGDEACTVEAFELKDTEIVRLRGSLLEAKTELDRTREERREALQRAEEAEWTADRAHLLKNDAMDELSRLKASLADGKQEAGETAAGRESYISSLEKERDRRVAEVAALERSLASARADANDAKEELLQLLEVDPTIGERTAKKGSKAGATGVAAKPHGGAGARAAALEEERDAMAAALERERAKSARLEGQLRFEVRRNQSVTVPGLAFNFGSTSEDEEEGSPLGSMEDGGRSISDRATEWLKANARPAIN